MKRLKFPHWSTLAVIFIAAVLFLAAFYTPREHGAVPTAGEITNWGLSFQKEGEPPVANATGEYLSQFDSVYCMPSEGKTIYITFDAGFENGNTEAILEATLRQSRSWCRGWCRRGIPLATTPTATRICPP